MKASHAMSLPSADTGVVGMQTTTNTQTDKRCMTYQEHISRSEGINLKKKKAYSHLNSGVNKEFIRPES